MSENPSALTIILLFVRMNSNVSVAGAVFRGSLAHKVARRRFRYCDRAWCAR